ncbi:MAG TPA: hypothetical protein VMF66_06010 [Candidatus Acidoferrum sp.]|nr:hypothetical protein [Candidatus Acidoferrum sp.]
MKIRFRIAAMLILLLFPALGSLALRAQDQPSASTSSRERWGLRGAVKTYTEERAYPGGTLTESAEYDSNGKVLTWRTRNPDGSEWVSTWTYDANGRAVKVVSGKVGQPPTQTLYAYDDQGRLLSVTNSENGDRTDYSYDEQGHKTDVQRFDPKTLERLQTGEVGFGGSAWDAGLAGFGVPTGGSVLTIYDENDRPIEEQIRDADGHIVSRVTRKYNAAGLVIEERPVAENPNSSLDKLTADQRSELNDAQAQTMAVLLRGRAGTVTSYTYDAQGRVTNKSETGGIMQSTTTTTYNDHGDVAEERTIMISTMAIGVPYSIAENGILTPSTPTSPASNVSLDSDVHYTYQYDEYGNWTEQAVTDGTHPDAPPAIRHRTLTYY